MDESKSIIGEFLIFSINLQREKKCFLNLKTKIMSKTKTDLTEKEIVQAEDTNAAAANGQKKPRRPRAVPHTESSIEAKK